MNWQEKLAQKDKDCLEKLAKIKDLEEQLAQQGKDWQELFEPENIQCLTSSLTDWYLQGMRGDFRDFFNNKRNACSNLPQTDPENPTSQPESLYFFQPLNQNREYQMA
jgi:hypothetical protein